MTLFGGSAIFTFTALKRGGALWNKQGREENGKEGGSRNLVPNRGFPQGGNPTGRAARPGPKNPINFQ